MEAINLFQHKPPEALAKYGNNPEVMKFFDKMTKILGIILFRLSFKNEILFSYF